MDPQRRSTGLYQLRHIVNSPIFFGQFAVFAAYGIAARIQGTGQLSVSETVTTLSLVNLLLNPLRNLIYTIPQAYSSVSCLRRIQEFLAQEPQTEHRLLGTINGTKSLETKDNAPGGQKSRVSDIELRRLNAKNNSSPNSASGQAIPAISVRDAVFGWSTQFENDNPLPADSHGLTFEIPGQGSLTVITGPVGCGKSTILKAILGETHFLQGRVMMSTPEVAYCSQDPWITNGSIRENIIGASDAFINAEWYSAVLTACALDTDLGHLPNGDGTLVGSKGVKLSGGQRQRIVRPCTAASN